MLDNLKIGTKIGASFALGVALFATIGLVSYQSATQFIRTAQEENKTYLVLSELEELMLTITAAETGQRGFIITGDERYLAPYRESVARVDGQIQDLRELLNTNVEQQQRLVELEALIAGRLAVMEEVLNIRRTNGFAASAAAVGTDQGLEIMQNLRQLIGAIEAEERQLLEVQTARSQTSARQMLFSFALGVPIYSILLALIGYALSRNISSPLTRISNAAERLSDGDLAVKIPESDRRDEIGVLTRTFNQMVANLRHTTQRNEEQNWLSSSLAELSQLLQGQRNLETVARLIMSELAVLVKAQHGVFYGVDRTDREPVLRLLGSYAYQERRNLANRFSMGEGLVGQCALEKQRILLTQVPGDYIRISSGLGEAPPLNIVVLPVLFEDQVTAVIELAAFQPFSDVHLAFLERVSEGIGVVLNTIAADMRNEDLLRQAQILTEELQVQQEELRESNELLEAKTRSLQESEALLKQQQEELQQSNEELQQLNEELEEKAELLAVRNRDVERKNHEIEQARQAIEEKAEQLALTSKYKSEFLANMSHELRTPLNSLLILARLLSDNGEGNLTGKQVEYSQTIYSAGTDLLELINDILDLAKIESGTMSVDVQTVRFADLQTYLENTFRQVADNKGLSFTVEMEDDLPPSITTDPKRLQQVLKNLLSNAFKFTEKGQVTLRMSTTPSLDAYDPRLRDVPAIAFAVMDTGIGVPAEKQKIIFEAFQQADGTTSRKYGGTGLGLSISREITHLLGGRIELMSQPGQGSTFTLYLPQDYITPTSSENGSQDKKTAASVTRLVTNATVAAPAAPAAANGATHPTAEPPAIAPAAAARQKLVEDDSSHIQPGDRTLLIIEDDASFAKILRDMAQQQGFKVVVALRSGEGLVLAQEIKPDAIMLDLLLPDMDGWTVLDQLKHNPTTRHIPVHIISAEAEQQRGLQQGAIAYLQKPVSPEAVNQALTNIKGFIERPVRKLLVVEDDRVQAQSIRELIGNGDVQTTMVGTGAEALTILQAEPFDCIVLDLGLPDMNGFDLIEQLKRQVEVQGRPPIPVIVYTGKQLTPQEETRLRRLAETIIVKDVRSPERLLDETALFLHRIQANLPQPKQQMLERLQQTDSVLAGKKVLIVDDDVRNIFALTSLLERYQMQVLYAENGRDGVETLQANWDVDVVLMDVMMPEMDGYETTQAIRRQEQFRHLPIIALTAKAMQGDREKCIEAGASDYISKPVNTEQLLSLLRVWLYR